MTQDTYKKISTASINENDSKIIFGPPGNFREISRILGVLMKILESAKNLPWVKNNKTITNFLKNPGFRFADVMKPCTLIT